MYKIIFNLLLLTQINAQNYIKINEDDIVEHITTDTIHGGDYPKWSCPIPYILDSDLEDSNRVIEAMDHISKRTGWTFIERTSEYDYLNFIDSNGCMSYLGKIGGKQNVWLAQACTVGNTIHEIGHAIGLKHEHTRLDRNDYINVNYLNIDVDYKYAFDMKDITNIGNYDYNSVMHYSQWAFAIDDDIKTIETIGNTSNVCRIGQRDKLSLPDIVHLNKLIENESCKTNSLEDVINECKTTSIEICGLNSDAHGFFNHIFTEFELIGITNGENHYRSIYPYFEDKYLEIYYYHRTWGTDYWKITYDGSFYLYNYDVDIIQSTNWKYWDGSSWVSDSDIIISQKECCQASNSNWVGDGYCDYIYNNELCYWDGGDCCQESCSDDAYDCGSHGYNCKDNYFITTNDPVKTTLTTTTSVPTKTTSTSTTTLTSIISTSISTLPIVTSIITTETFVSLPTITSATTSATTSTTTSITTLTITPTSTSVSSSANSINNISIPYKKLLILLSLLIFY